MQSRGTRLKKRGGTWYIVWTGNSRGRSTKTGDRLAAEKKLATFILSGDASLEPGNPLTVVEALDHYWVEHAEGLPSAEQISIASDFLKAHFGGKRVIDLVEDDFRSYAHKRSRRRLTRTQGREPIPASDATIRRELGVLAAALMRETRKKDLVTKRARLSRTDVPHIPLPPAPPPRDRWLTADEERRLLESCHVETKPPDGRKPRLTRIYRFLILAMDTAGRKEALEGLTWFQVDMEARTIDLNPPGRRQTKKRRAKVRMSNRLYDVMKRAYDERTACFVLDHDGSIRTSLETVTTRAGFHDVTAHVFRHTWATRAARAGVSMREIADVLGDAIETVERNYMHHHPDFQRDAVNWRDREKR